MTRWHPTSAVLATLSAVALVATACGGGGSTPTASSTTSKAATTTPPSTGGATSSTASAASGPVTLNVEVNGVVGGKNAAEADWITKFVIPNFEKQMKAQGKDVTVKFTGSGVSGTDYANKLALDLKSGGGPDVFDLDGPYYGEFVQAGYLKSLTQVVGAKAAAWSGWSQIPKTVQAITTYKGTRYGIPNGTDGRILYYNKQLFAKAGLPTDWHPTSWADILSAARALKAKDPGIEALQIDAGSQMGEATTLQGFLPFLAGAGQLVYDTKTGKWQGSTPALKAAADFYHTVYSSGLGNAQLQLGSNGRNQTFQLFSQGKVGIYLESTYLWESVIAPQKTALYPMANRNKDVGYTLIPAEAPGKGIRGQSFVSMSGGGGQTINPHTKHPQLAWDLLTYMNSKAAILDYEKAKPFISARQDVNAVALANHPLEKFVAQKVLPITAYRPSLAVYPQVSLAIQSLAQSLATGTSVTSAVKTYGSAVTKVVGAGNVTGS